MKSLSQLGMKRTGPRQYARIIALVAFAAVVGMNTLAADINDAFNKVDRCSTLISRNSLGERLSGLSWFLRAVSRGNPDKRN
jgi:hypothetical protein